MAISKSALNIGRFYKKNNKSRKDETGASKISTPSPEDETVAFGDTAAQVGIGIGPLREIIERGADTTLGDLVFVNQSDLSRHGAPPTDDLFDMKNRLVNLSSNKQKHTFQKFNTSMPLTLDCGIDADSDNRETHTVQSIEDATGRLSNLVRLMDENSKIIQPSDLTVQSYKSESISN